MAMAVRWKMNVKHMKTELKTWEKRYEHHTKHAQISFYLYYLSLLFTARVTSGNNNTICCEYGCQTKKKIIHFPISQWEWIACHEVAVDGIDTDTDSNGRKSKRVDNFTENMGTVCVCVCSIFGWRGRVDSIETHDRIESVSTSNIFQIECRFEFNRNVSNKINIKWIIFNERLIWMATARASK